MPLRLLGFIAVVALIAWLIWPDATRVGVAIDLSPPRTASAMHASTTAASMASSRPARASSYGVSVPADDATPILLEGQVVDGNQRPVGGATVRYNDAHTISEADGSFSFPNVPTGTVVIRAELGELYGEDSRWVDADSDPLEVRIQRGPTLDLRVVRAATGEPIRGAKVDISNREVLTDADGRVTLRGLDVTGERFTVTADGFAAWRDGVEFDAEHPTATKELTIRLATGASISGIVVDENGDRVAEGYVQLVSASGTWRESVSADATGAWSLPAIGPGKHTLGATSTLHLATPDMTVETDGVTPTTGIVVKVTLGAQLVGRVIDDAGAPVKGASLRGAYGVETDADGRFTAVGLEPGVLEISAYDATRGSDMQKVTVAVGKRTEVLFTLRTSRIAGRVVDRAGIPIADASVYIREAREDGTSYFATTDAYGAFDTGGVVPGDYKLVAQRPEEIKRRLPDDEGAYVAARSGTRDVTIVLPEIATVRGRVVLDGAPVAYFGVSVKKPTDGRYGQSPTTYADTGGAFAQSDITPGTWAVEITGPGFATKLIADVVVAEGSVTDLGTIAVDRGRIVRGKVVDGFGRGIAGALVAIGTNPSVLAADRIDQRVQGDATATSSADGTFEVAGIAPDAKDLSILARTATALSPEQPLADAATTIILTLEETGTITGRIANYRAQSGVIVTDEQEHRYRGEIDAAGDFTVTGVPAGSYSVRVMGTNTLAPRPAVVIANATVTVAFTLPPNPITLEVVAADCSYLTLDDAIGTRTLEVCSDEATRIVTFGFVEPGAKRVCDSADHCVDIVVAAAPAKQRITVPLPRDQ